MSQPPAAAAPRADLFDPSSLAELGHLEVVARWVVDGFVTGLHRSPRKGFSAEFSEHRPYQPGDDPRYVDWKIAARADRMVVKQFEEETNLRATVVLDVSRSMDWSGSSLAAGDRRAGPARLTKLAYANRLTAALALLLLRQRDAVGLIRFDDAVRSMVPPRSRQGQWRRLVAALEEPGAGPDSRAALALEQAARLVRRPGLVVLVSDLLMERADVERAVRALRAVGHDVTVLHLLDPVERDFDVTTSALFYDPESGAQLPASASVRGAYQAAVTAALGEWRDTLAAAGAGYEVVLTSEPFGVPLRRAFAARQRVQRA
ncbi:MAG: hypothetical protein AVDCRST_MAG40-2960 [uncultured Gemmatimonadaceae bacterium]|uniref:DUF58 domain-containing protein n=1 Tax=uncultured Gemmatimonadaceae bacterium TaxID=246130 RepID=A0A6J4M8K2_9BACT|nr:MAG: hypothetical protein AVDCRST_MAG40-2960 [uncultured Gemmatimonadaceae bacterium]